MDDWIRKDGKFFLKSARGCWIRQICNNSVLTTHVRPMVHTSVFEKFFRCWMPWTPPQNPCISIAVYCIASCIALYYIGSCSSLCERQHFVIFEEWRNLRHQLSLWKRKDSWKRCTSVTVFRRDFIWSHLKFYQAYLITSEIWSMSDACAISCRLLSAWKQSPSRDLPWYLLTNSEIQVRNIPFLVLYMNYFGVCLGFLLRYEVPNFALQ